MLKEHPELRIVNEALDRFEEAVHKHAKASILSSEVALRQEVDRSRDKVFEAIVEVMKMRRATPV